jgi:hypothetical protein
MTIAATEAEATAEEREEFGRWVFGKALANIKPIPGFDSAKWLRKARRRLQREAELPEEERRVIQERRQIRTEKWEKRREKLMKKEWKLFRAEKAKLAETADN